MRPLANQAFTVRFNGKSQRLITEIEILPAFDPVATPVPPQGKKYQALYDTGATNSAISPKVVQELNLPSIGAKNVGVGGGTLQTTAHLVNIGLPNRVGFAYLSVTKMVLLGGIDALIGMDILGAGDFAVTHRDGKTTFSFCVPSRKEIDFVTEINDFDKTHKPSKNAPCPCGSGKKYKACHGRR